jgi:hypothetical protein
MTDDHAFTYAPCRVEYLHEGAHQCDTEGCEVRPEDHPNDE